MIRLQNRATIGLLSLILLIPALAFSQTPAAVAPPAARLAFEVASIKPAETITAATVAAGKLHVGMTVIGSRVDIGYMTLADLIPMAYKVKSYRGRPRWRRHSGPTPPSQRAASRPSRLREHR